jgi:murein DD-endopeptidase MepM/ murein hydrolase activator NlpD
MRTDRAARMQVSIRRRLGIGYLLLLLAGPAFLPGQPFTLPTENQAIFEPAGPERYFVPTPGKTWISGTFGCVRSEGRQFHEGIDIRSLQRNKRGEPTDPIRATAHGTVVYVNRVAGNSSFGKYLMVRHEVEGLEVFSLYAHLSEIRPDLSSGRLLEGGETIGVMGRSANTRSGISKDRAHLHFELNLLLNDHFAAWYKAKYPKGRNEHGNWNGQALLGLDPWRIFLAQREEGTNFSLVRLLQNETDLCRVWVSETNFSWLTRFPALIRPNPLAAREGTAGYEVALDYVGLPFQLTPRARSELNITQPFQLLSVNLLEQQRHPCRRLIVWRRGRWELSKDTLELLDLLTH